jgi:hypothetical protein
MVNPMCLCPPALPLFSHMVPAAGQRAQTERGVGSQKVMTHYVGSPFPQHIELGCLCWWNQPTNLSLVMVCQKGSEGS